MNPQSDKNPLAPLYCIVCAWVFVWGVSSSACANSEKEICNQWRGAMTELTEFVGSGKQTVGTELNDLVKEK